MIQLARRLQAVKPSATLLLSQKAQEMKAAGEDVINLTAGEPDFATPAWVCEAATQAMNQGQTRYTPVGGTAGLKAAIIRKFARDNDLTYTPGEVIVSTGGKQVLFNALMATLSPGDEVIVLAPYWTSYPEMVLVAEGTPVIVPCAADNGFKITPAQLEAALTPRTRWVIFNAPSNPTGVMYTRPELEALGQVLMQHPQVWVLTDDIYEHLVFEGVPFYTLPQVVPALKDRTLVVNGVSKTYAMTGWRIGYGAGPQPLIKAMTDLQSHSTSNPCSVAQAGALAALDGDQLFIQTWRQAFQDRRDRVMALLGELTPLRAIKPGGAFYLFPSCKALIGRVTPDGQRLETDEAVCHYFLNECGVALVPGSAFGSPGHVRMSFAIDQALLDKAVRRLAGAIAQLGG